MEQKLLPGFEWHVQKNRCKENCNDAQSYTAKQHLFAHMPRMVRTFTHCLHVLANARQDVQDIMQDMHFRKQYGERSCDRLFHQQNPPSATNAIV